MRQFPVFPQVQAKIGILGVACDCNSSYKRGSAAAPQKIRKAFFCDSSNLWTESGIDLGKPGLFADAGDIQPSPQAMPSETERAAEKLHKAGLKVLAFGGDHAVTYPLVLAALKTYPELSILHFDAHPDLYDDFEGNPHSHASPFARIMETGRIKRLVQVGIRTANGHQREQARRFGIDTLSMGNWRDVFGIRFDTPLYVSFDMDGLDPAFAPGVSHCEPGGLSTREALSIIQALEAPVVAADIVEYNPRRDRSAMTAMVAAKLFKEIAAKMLE